MSDPLPEDTVLVASRSPAVYHTTRCKHVAAGHLTKSRTWAERSRVDECTVCAGTADTPEGSTFDSPAHELRKEARADD
jgi:hypothetical protein